MTVNVTYLVGSKHENYGETGMAHLLEHLVFKAAAPSEYSAGMTEQRHAPERTTVDDRQIILRTSPRQTKI